MHFRKQLFVGAQPPEKQPPKKHKNTRNNNKKQQHYKQTKKQQLWNVSDTSSGKPLLNQISE